MTTAPKYLQSKYPQQQRPCTFPLDSKVTLWKPVIAEFKLKTQKPVPTARVISHIELLSKQNKVFEKYV